MHKEAQRADTHITNRPAESYTIKSTAKLVLLTPQRVHTTLWPVAAHRTKQACPRLLMEARLMTYKPKASTRDTS